MKIQHNIYHPIRRYRNVLKAHARICDIHKDVYYVSWLTARQHTKAKSALVKYFYKNSK